MPASTPGTRVFAAPAHFRYPGKDDSPATVNLRRRNRRDRLAAVVKTWAICWLAAVAAVFLPLLHFILVPALFLGGPVYALAQYQEHTTLLGGTGPCPACGAAIKLTQKRRAVATVALRCDACGRPLQLVIGPEHLEDDPA